MGALHAHYLEEVALAVDIDTLSDLQIAYHSSWDQDTDMGNARVLSRDRLNGQVSA